MNLLFLNRTSTIIPCRNTPLTFLIRFVVTSGLNMFVSLYYYIQRVGKWALNSKSVKRGREEYKELK